MTCKAQTTKTEILIYALKIYFFYFGLLMMLSHCNKHLVVLEAQLNRSTVGL